MAHLTAVFQHSLSAKDPGEHKLGYGREIPVFHLVSRCKEVEQA